MRSGHIASAPEDQQPRADTRVEESGVEESVLCSLGRVMEPLKG